MPVDNSKEYETKLQKLISEYVKKIQEIYHAAIVQVSLQSTLVKYKGSEFNLDLFPALKKEIDKVIKKMHDEITTTIHNSVKDAWDLSNGKNNSLVDDFLTGININKKDRPKLYNPNYGALKAFSDRVEGGMNLSKRVWNLTKPYQFELEAGLKDGIGKGESAASIANKLKRYLNEPDKLFRRVRDENGKLQLSKAAKAYNPGQGIYRSSYQNALRLTSTETNISYRRADHNRWKQTDFITGIEIKLSASHEFKTHKGKICKCEICEIFTGKYPKDFVFTGWHPRCKCYQTSILMSKEEYKKLLDFKYGRSDKEPKIDYVTSLPPDFKNFLQNNKERIQGWNNQPYWLKDNPQYIGNIAVSGMAGNTSLKLHTTLANKLTDKRLELHKNIVGEVIGKGSSKKGTIYLTGGAPANGKSTLTDSGKIKYPKNILTIDPDDIKKKIPEYNNLIAAKNANAAAFVHEESSMIGKKVVKEALNKNFDFIQDGVGDGKFEDLAKKVQGYQSAGKKVRADYVTLDTDLSLKLADARAIKTGRMVPKDYILDMNREISKIIPEAIKRNTFDELYLWDTNIEKNPRLILSQVEGKLTIFDSNLYDRFLKKAKYGKK